MGRVHIVDRRQRVEAWSWGSTSLGGLGLMQVEEDSVVAGSGRGAGRS